MNSCMNGKIKRKLSKIQPVENQIVNLGELGEMPDPKEW